jgi:ganglioside-induced differentiation-associated protein 1
MPLLAPSEVTSSAARAHRGVHLYHDPHASPCCRAVRICLKLKRIPYATHDISLHKFDNLKPAFFAINPRGLVPVLVHDGKVHVETADIIAYIDKAFPESGPRLLPGALHARAMQLLVQADTLRISLRTISLALQPRFAQKAMAKTRKRMILTEMHRQKGDDDDEQPVLSVGGRPDNDVPGQSRSAMLEFWMQLLSEDFSAEYRTQAYAMVFAGISAFEGTLKEENGFLLDHAGGNSSVPGRLSAVDVVWWVVVGRFLSFLRDEKVAQFHRVAPRMTAWHKRLSENPAFCEEAEKVPESEKSMRRLRRCLMGNMSGGMAGFFSSSWFSVVLLVVLVGLMYLSANWGFVQKIARTT